MTANLPKQSHSFSEHPFSALRQLFARKKNSTGGKSGKRISTKDLFTDSLVASTVRSYMVMPGQPVWMDRNYPQFALEAYIRNVIAHRAMGMVSGAASSVKFKLYDTSLKRGKREITRHPLLDLIKQANPTQAKGEFFQALYQYKLISGNAFIQAVGPKDTPPNELHLLRPDRVAVLAGKGTMPSGYRYTVGSHHVDFPVDRYTGQSKILHLKTFHPLNDWYGLSPIEAAAYSIDQHNQAGAWNQSLLQNGARPSGALVVRAESPGGGTLSESQYNRVKLQIDEQFTGSINAGRPLLLEGGLDWKEMSMTPKDMDFIEAKNSSARDIALAFGVPPQMLGIPGDNTYANLQEARLALWEQTVVPLVWATTDALNSWLLPMFRKNLELVPDTDAISALAIRNQAIWDRVQQATFLTTDEKRAAVGYGPLPVPPKPAKPRRKKPTAKRRRKDDGVFGDDGGDYPDDVYPTSIDAESDDDGAYQGLDMDDLNDGNNSYGLDAFGALAGIEGVAGLGETEGLEEEAGLPSASASALADQISNGHAYDSHVVDGEEFPSIDTREDFSDHIAGILDDPDAVKNLQDGRMGYWDNDSGTLVVHDPANEDGGTAFVSRTGKDYFDKLK